MNEELLIKLTIIYCLLQLCLCGKWDEKFDDSAQMAHRICMFFFYVVVVRIYIQSLTLSLNFMHMNF